MALVPSPGHGLARDLASQYGLDFTARLLEDIETEKLLEEERLLDQMGKQCKCRPETRNSRTDWCKGPPGVPLSPAVPL